MSTDFAVELNGVGFSYVGKQTPPQLMFDCLFGLGKITAIMGASGSGKSTLLSLIAGFEQAHGGTIVLNGADCTTASPATRPLSMVFQENNLFAHLSIGKNVGLGISAKLRLTADEQADISKALADVGLDGYENRLPAQLSGGERQRVALARVLVRRQPILLLDEAFASLGPGLRQEMLDVVKGLANEHKMTVLMVTHSPEDALQIADDVVFLDQGRVVQAGKAQDVLRADSDNLIVRSYLGSEAKPSK